jgi:hypothetical protein
MSFLISHLVLAIGEASACLLASQTMKHGAVSSTVHGGRKRRGGLVELAMAEHGIGISRTGPRWCVLSADRCLAANKDGIASASTSPPVRPFTAKDAPFLPRRFPVAEFGKHRPS